MSNASHQFKSKLVHELAEVEYFIVEPLPVATARQRLQCALKFISIDHEMHFGVVMAAGDALPDLQGTIQLMLSLDPLVNEIRIFGREPADGMIFKRASKDGIRWIVREAEVMPPKKRVVA
jgi:hypothetical protein